MKWGALMNATLGLMFSNVSGTSKVEPSAANVQEYVLNMPDCANSAFADLAEVCPVVLEKEFTLPHETRTISLEKEFPLFHKLLEDECLRHTDNGVFPFTGYLLHGQNKLTFADNATGVVTLTAAVRPIFVDNSITNDTDIAYPDKAMTAVMYYMAHRLYLEDDISVAMHYLNYYQTLKEELSNEFSRAGYGFKEYTNKAGWL